MLTFLLGPSISPQAQGAIHWRSLHTCIYDDALNLDMGGRRWQGKGREGGKNSKQKICGVYAVGMDPERYCKSKRFNWSVTFTRISTCTSLKNHLAPQADSSQLEIICEKEVGNYSGEGERGRAGQEVDARL